MTFICTKSNNKKSRRVYQNPTDIYNASIQGDHIPISPSPPGSLAFAESHGEVIASAWLLGGFAFKFRVGVLLVAR